MRVYDINDQDGRLVAFEIDSGRRQPRGIRRLISALPGARVIAPGLADERVDGERLRFERAAILFLVVEAAGNENRCWVGPRPQRFSETTGVVRTAFSDYQPAV